MIQNLKSTFFNLWCSAKEALDHKYKLFVSKAPNFWHTSKLPEFFSTSNFYNDFVNNWFNGFFKSLCFSLCFSDTIIAVVLPLVSFYTLFFYFYDPTVLELIISMCKNYFTFFNAQIDALGNHVILAVKESLYSLSALKNAYYSLIDGVLQGFVTPMLTKMSSYAYALSQWFDPSYKTTHVNRVGYYVLCIGDMQIFRDTTNLGFFLVKDHNIVFIDYSDYNVRAFLNYVLQRYYSKALPFTIPYQPLNRESFLSLDVQRDCISDPKVLVGHIVDNLSNPEVFRLPFR